MTIVEHLTEAAEAAARVALYDFSYKTLAETLALALEEAKALAEEDD